jgi:hypothetical protein
VGPHGHDERLLGVFPNEVLKAHGWFFRKWRLLLRGESARTASTGPIEEGLPLALEMEGQVQSSS